MWLCRATCSCAWHAAAGVYFIIRYHMTRRTYVQYWSTWICCCIHSVTCCTASLATQARSRTCSAENMASEDCVALIAYMRNLSLCACLTLKTLGAIMHHWQLVHVLVEATFYCLVALMRCDWCTMYAGSTGVGAGVPGTPIGESIGESMRAS